MVSSVPTPTLVHRLASISTAPPFGLFSGASGPLPHFFAIESRRFACRSSIDTTCLAHFFAAPSMHFCVGFSCAHVITASAHFANPLRALAKNDAPAFATLSSHATSALPGLGSL